MYLYSICLVSTTCCDTTISQHKHNNNIQELRTLPNALLPKLIGENFYPQISFSSLVILQLGLANFFTHKIFQHCDTQFVAHAAAQLYIHVVIGHNSIIIHHKFLWTHGCCGEVIINYLYSQPPE